MECLYCKECKIVIRPKGFAGKVPFPHNPRVAHKPPYDTFISKHEKNLVLIERPREV